MLDFSCDTCPRDGTDLSSAALTSGGATTPSGFEYRDNIDFSALNRDPAFRSKYEFVSVLGSGGMAIIYKARQLTLEKLVAIKMMHAHLMSEKSRARFQLEARTSSMLSHPYIVTLRDYGTTASGQPFMVMDFIEGLTLAQVISREGPLSTRRFLRLFHQVTEALSHAHKRSVLHRDIKPSNIMLVKDDFGEEEIRVMDFGIAKVLNDDPGSELATRTGEMLGSPLYMSPEASRGQPTDRRSDLYSLGCVMYESLTGTPPFSGNSVLDTMLMHLNDRPRPLQEASERLEPVDSQIESIIMRLLEKKPDARYRDMDEVRDELLAIELGKQAPLVVAATKSHAAEDSRTFGRLKLLIIAAGVVATFGLGGFFWWLSGGPEQQSNHLARTEQEQNTLSSSTKSQNASPIEDETTQNSHFPESSKAALTNDKQSHPISDVMGPLDVLDEDKRPYLKAMNNSNEPKLNLKKVFELYGAFTKSELTLLDPKKLSHLEEVKLNNSEMTDELLEDVSKLRPKVINLSGNDVADLHALEKMTSLEVLYLANTSLNDAGMKVISTLPKIYALDLQKTFIKDGSLNYLERMKNLRWINLSECPNLTRAALMKLRRATPTLQVTALGLDEPIPTAAAGFLRQSATFEKRESYAQADETFDAAIKVIEDVPKPPQETLFNLLRKRSEVCGRQRRYDASAKYSLKATRVGNKLFPNSMTLADQYLRQANTYQTLKNYSASAKAREQAVAILERARTSRTTPAQRIEWENISLLNSADLVEQYYALDKKDKSGKAESASQNYIQSLKRFGRSDSVTMAQAHLRLGYLYIDKGALVKALPQFKQAQAIFHRHPAEFTSGARDEVLWARAFAERGLKDFVAAETDLKQCIQIKETSERKIQEYSVLIECMNNLGKSSQTGPYKQKLEQLKAAWKKIQSQAKPTG
jgi:serine/threonine protein kinase